MERKAADFVFEIYEFQLALFVIGRCRHIGGKALIFKESKRAEGEVAADCNVTVCAAIWTFHNLEERSRKDTAGSFVRSEHCEAAELIDSRPAVVFVLCVDADVFEAEAVHFRNSLICQTGDFFVIFALYQRLLDHKAASARNNARQGEIVHHIVKADASLRHKAQTLIWSRHRLDCRRSAVCLCGEELDGVKSESHSLLHFAARCAAGNDSHSL